MIILRILKHADPLHCREISPTYSTEAQTVASDPKTFEQWAQNSWYTAQIYFDKYFQRDTSKIEELRQMILKQQSTPYYLKRAAQVKAILGRALDSPEALNEYMQYEENNQKIYKE